MVDTPSTFQRVTACVPFALHRGTVFVRLVCCAAADLLSGSPLPDFCNRGPAS
jgi:hypothetical protein